LPKLLEGVTFRLISHKV